MFHLVDPVSVKAILGQDCPDSHGFMLWDDRRKLSVYAVTQTGRATFIVGDRSASASLLDDSIHELCRSAEECARLQILLDDLVILRENLMAGVAR